MGDHASTLFGPPMIGGAMTSPCEVYRYSLTRTWDDGGAERLLWVMLNPSTADAFTDDPTLRRCIQFTKTWGYGGLEVVNLFALRATDPAKLAEHPHPMGPENRDIVRSRLATHRLVVVAWGSGIAHAGLKGAAAAAWTRATANGLELQMQCLGMTQSGQPRHPLYVRGDTPLRPYERPAAA